MSDKKTVVEHQPANLRFIVPRNEGVAELSYQLPDESRVHFVRTYVPPELRKQQLAEKLVRTGLAWAKECNKTVTTECWYVEKFL